MKSLNDIYQRRALLSYKSDACKALSSSLATATIAWFGLYLAYALKTDEVVYPVFGFAGCVLLPIMAFGWYSKGKSHTTEVAKLDAEISQT